MKEVNANMKEHVSFFVENKGIAVKITAILLMIAAICRLIGCWGMWTDSFYLYTQILLPIVACLLYILFLLTLGGKAFWTTVLPAIMGAGFFIIRAFGFDSRLHTVLCILLVLLGLVLYIGTAFALIRTKWLLVPLFALPLIYQIGVEDRMALLAGGVTLQAALQEVSVLCILLALLITAFALRKRRPLPPPDLPKMKDPKVWVGERPPEPPVPSEGPVPRVPPEGRGDPAPEKQPTERDNV